MRKTNETNSSGEWLSVKNFSFPEKCHQKVTIIYTNFTPENFLGKTPEGSYKSIQEPFSKLQSLSNASISHKPTLSRYPTPSNRNLTTAFSNQTRSHNKSACSTSNIFKKKPNFKDTSALAMFTPESNKRKDVLGLNCIVKKPLHPGKILNFYKNSIKKFRSPERTSSTYQVNTRILLRNSTNPHFLSLKKMKIQTFIPQPVLSATRNEPQN